MNEFTKHLFEKAGGIVEVCDVTRDEVLTYSEEMDPEKFADMIIRNCIFEIAHESTVGEYGDHIQSFVNNAVDRITTKFGIK